MLYQRYFLRMNQNNAVHIVWLLFALIFILTLIHLLFLVFVKSSSMGHECSSIQQEPSTVPLLFTDNAVNVTLFSNDSMEFEVLLNLTDSLQSTESIVGLPSEDCDPVRPTNFLYILKNSSLQLGMLGLCTVLYTILLLCLYKQRINEIYLFHVSYAIIVSLVAIDISFSITPQGK